MRLLADDLTGALDSAAQFTARLGPIPVYFRLADARAPGHAALDVACRDGSQAEAIAAMQQAAMFLQGDLAFKKIDSLLRGHWAAELAALLGTGLFRHCILAPAFPELGRVTIGGRQHLIEADGSLRNLAADIPSALDTFGMMERVLVLDAQSAADLDAVVQYGRALPGPVLWCGSAGLARALAGEAARPFALVSRPALALIGSHHPVMQAQLAAARATGSYAVLALGSDPLEAAGRIKRALAVYPCCVAYFALPDALPSSAAAQAIEARIKGLLPCLDRPETLIVAGGETLRAVCEASLANHLVVLGENRPGIPCSRIVGGRWDGVPVVSKSGAFGSASFFAELMDGTSQSQ